MKLKVLKKNNFTILILRLKILKNLIENCYIVFDNNSLEAVIIDPGGELDFIKKIIKKYNLKLKFILLTHAHFDHIGAVSKLKNKYQLKVLINKNDLLLLKSNFIQNLFIFKLNFKKIKVDGYLENNQEINFGNLKIKVIYTPGHTLGSSCFLIDEILFSGDTLFKNSIGRCDLPFSDCNLLLKSIKEKLLNLNDKIMVFAGHGFKTTIGKEKKQNPFLKF